MMRCNIISLYYSIIAVIMLTASYAYGQSNDADAIRLYDAQDDATLLSTIDNAAVNNTESSTNDLNIQTEILRSIDSSAIGVHIDPQIRLDAWRNITHAEAGQMLKSVMVRSLSTAWPIATQNLRNLVASPAPVSLAENHDDGNGNYNILLLRLGVLEQLGAVFDALDIVSLLNSTDLEQSELHDDVTKLWLYSANYDGLCNFIRTKDYVSYINSVTWSKLDLFCAIYFNNTDYADFSLRLLRDEGIITDKEAVLVGGALGYFDLPEHIISSLGSLDGFLYHLAYKANIIDPVISNNSQTQTLLLDYAYNKQPKTAYYLHERGILHGDKMLAIWQSYPINDIRFNMLMAGNVNNVTINDYAVLYRAFKEARLLDSKIKIINRLLHYAQEQQKYFYMLQILAHDIKNVPATPELAEFALHGMMHATIQDNAPLYQAWHTVANGDNDVISFYRMILDSGERLGHKTNIAVDDASSDNILDATGHHNANSQIELEHDKNLWFSIIKHTSNQNIQQQLAELFMHYSMHYDIALNANDYAMLQAYSAIGYQLSLGSINNSYLNYLVDEQKQASFIINMYNILQQTPPNASMAYIWSIYNKWASIGLSQSARYFMMHYFDQFGIYPNITQFHNVNE